MKDLVFRCNVLAVIVLALALASLVNAQATRTWVSGVGSDVNPCSRTAPCKTFSGALSKTTAGGEINCLDAGEFGNGASLTINQAITIDCGGTFGSIQIPGGAPAVVINAGMSDVVTLRNLSMSGGGFASEGILYSAARVLHLENLRISAPGGAVCVEFAAAASTLLTVDSTTLSECNYGVLAGTTSGTAVMYLKQTRITNTIVALQAQNGSRVLIQDSTVYFNNQGARQFSFDGNFNLGSTMTVLNSTLGFSSSTALQGHSGEFILAFGNTFVNNFLDFDTTPGGTIFTGADNNNSGSTPGTANGGTVPKI